MARRSSSGSGIGILVLIVVGIIVGFTKLWHRSPALALVVLGVVFGGFVWLGNSGGANTGSDDYSPTSFDASQSSITSSTPLVIASPSPSSTPFVVGDTKPTPKSKTNKGSVNSSSTSTSSYGSSDGDHYTNVDAERVRRPTFSKSVPAGASAQCRDGSYSFSRNRRGTCSRHGGVARWL